MRFGDDEYAHFSCVKSVSCTALRSLNQGLGAVVHGISNTSALILVEIDRSGVTYFYSS